MKRVEERISSAVESGGLANPRILHKIHWVSKSTCIIPRLSYFHISQILGRVIVRFILVSRLAQSWLLIVSPEYNVLTSFLPLTIIAAFSQPASVQAFAFYYQLAH